MLLGAGSVRGVGVDWVASHLLFWRGKHKRIEKAFEYYGTNKGKLPGVPNCNFYSVAVLVFLVKRFQLGFKSQIATFCEHGPLILNP